MEDKRFEKVLEQQQNRQKGEATTRYFNLLGESAKLIDGYRVFIADMHVQRLAHGFEGLDRLKDAVNELEDAQRELHVGTWRIQDSEDDESPIVS